jgi:hypothetical protein
MNAIVPIHVDMPDQATDLPTLALGRLSAFIDQEAPLAERVLGLVGSPEGCRALDGL